MTKVTINNINIQALIEEAVGVPENTEIKTVTKEHVSRDILKFIKGIQQEVVEKEELVLVNSVTGEEVFEDSLLAKGLGYAFEPVVEDGVVKHYTYTSKSGVIYQFSVDHVDTLTGRFQLKKRLGNLGVPASKYEHLSTKEFFNFVDNIQVVYSLSAMLISEDEGESMQTTVYRSLNEAVHATLNEFFDNEAAQKELYENGLTMDELKVKINETLAQTGMFDYSQDILGVVDEQERLLTINGSSLDDEGLVILITLNTDGYENSLEMRPHVI